MIRDSVAALDECIARCLVDQMAIQSSGELRMKMDELAQYLGITSRHPAAGIV